MNGENCIGILKGLLGFQRRMQLAEVYFAEDASCKRESCPEQVKQTLYTQALEEAIRCVEKVYGLDGRESSSCL